MDMLKLVAAAWFGACLRNESDRKKTLEFFNSIGTETEKVVKGFFQGGVSHAQPTQPEDEQGFV